MAKMTKLHICSEDVAILRPAEVQVFYSETTDTWWMEMGLGGSCAINYCPFCGLELAKGEEMGWPCEEDSDGNDKDE